MSLETFQYAPQNSLHFTGYQLRDHLNQRQEERFQFADHMRQSIQCTSELEHYNASMKQRFLDHLGPIPFDNAPLAPQVLSTVQLPGYRIENIRFQSRQDVWVTSSLYIPNGLTAPSAAVLFVCGHSAGGRLDEKYQTVCSILADAGLIVFAIDPVGQGERRGYFDKAQNKHLVEPCTYDHDAAGIPSIATGRFMEAYFLCDQMRAVDYMLTRPEIDPNRIGITGNSGGGTQTMAMMAVDDRLAAAAPGTFVTSRRSYLAANDPQDCEQIWFGITQFGYDHINPIMNFAPKPCAILAVKYDFFPIEGTRKTVQEAKRFYRMYGKEENLVLFEDFSHHMYTPWLARQAAAFFAKHLLDREIQPEALSANVLPRQQLWTTHSGNVCGEIPKARFVHDDVVDMAKELREKRLSKEEHIRLSEAEKWLRSVVFYSRQPGDFNVRFCQGSAQAQGLACKSIMWRSQKDLFNIAQLIYSQGKNWQKQPLVAALWTDGTKAIDAHRDWIQQACAEGNTVAVIDLTAMGNAEPLTFRGGPLKACYSTLYTACGYFMYLKDSLAALRIYDVLRTMTMFREELGYQEAQLSLYCEGDHGVYALPAAFLDKSIHLKIGSGASFSVEQRYIKPWFTAYDDDLSLILPGMLQYFDYPELVTPAL